MKNAFHLNFISLVRILNYLFIEQQVKAQISGTVGSSVATVQSLTVLSFDLDSFNSVRQTLAAGSIIELIFPQSQFANYFASFPSPTRLSSDQCYGSYGFAPNDGLICTVIPSSSKLQVQLTMDAAFSSLGFTIEQVVNIDMASTSLPITINIWDQQQVLQDSTNNQGSSTFTLKTDAGALQNVLLSHTSKKVAEYGQLTVSFNTQHSIRNNFGSVMLVFPKWDADSGISPKIESYLKNDDCSLSVDAQHKIDAAATCFLTKSSTSDSVLIKNAFTPQNGAAAGALVSFTIQNVRNARSFRGVRQIQVKTLLGDSLSVDESLENGFAPTQPADLPAENCLITTANTQAGAKTDLTLRLKLSVPVGTGGLIKVTFPPEIRLSDQIGNQFVKQVQRQGKADGQVSFQMASSTGSTYRDTVIITNAITEYRQANTVILLVFQQVQNPPSSARSSPFKFLISDVQNGIEYPIQVNTNGLTIRTEPQKLTDYQTLSSNQTAFAGFDLQIQTRFNGIMNQNYFLEYQYTSDLIVNPNIQSDSTTIPCKMSIASINYSPLCTITLSKNIIRVDSFLNGAQQQQIDFTQRADGIILVQMLNAFVNPGSTKPIDIGFNISLKDQDNNTAAFFTPVPGYYVYTAKPLISQLFSVSAFTQTTGALSPYDIGFNFNLEGRSLQTGTYLVVNLPPQVQLGSNQQIDCIKLSILLLENPNCSSSIIPSTSAQSITVNNIQLQSLVGPVSFSFRIQYLRNPYSTQPTDSFGISLFTRDNYLIASQSSQLTAQMTIPSQFTSVSVVRGSQVNGQGTSYTFIVQLRSPVPDQSVLVIEPPSSITVGARQGTYIDCQGAEQLNTQLLCQLINKQIFVNLRSKLGGPFDAGSSISVTLFNVQNPKSLEVSQSFKLFVRSQDQAYAYMQQEQGIVVANTQAGQIQQAAITADNPLLGAESIYRVTFLPQNALPQQAIVILTLPSTLQQSPTTPLGCSGITNLDQELACKFDPVTYQVTIQTHIQRDFTIPQETAFEVSGFKNPLQPQFQSPFTLQTFASNGFLIDQTTNGLTINQACDYPCKTCGLTKKNCLSCQTDQTYKYLFNNTCIQTCPPGQYADADFTCQPCGGGCQQCKDSPNFCTQCQSSQTFLHAATGKCVENCPDGQFTNLQSGVCLDCDPSCTTCTSQTECRSCQNKLFLHNGSCLAKCPISKIPSKDGLTCIDCDTACKTCNVTVDQCTSCDLNSQRPYLYGYQCLKSCPDSYFPDVIDGQTCVLVSEDVVPFVFLGISLLIFVIQALISSVCKHATKKIPLKNTLIALIAVICLGNWWFLLYLTIKDRMWQSAVVLLYGIVSSYVLNAIFFCLYWKVIRQKQQYGLKIYEIMKSEKLLSFLALISSFQLYRIIFQDLAEQAQKHKSEAKPLEIQVTNVDFQQEGGLPVQDQKDDQQLAEKAFLQSQYKYADETTIKSIVNKLTVIMLACVIFPVLVQNIYNLFFTNPGRQLFWEDAESIAITGFLLVMMTYDSIKKTKKYEGRNLAKFQKSGEGEQDAAKTSQVQKDYENNNPAPMSVQEMLRFREALSQMIHLSSSASSNSIRPLNTPLQNGPGKFAEQNQIQRRLRDLGRAADGYTERRQKTALDASAISINTEDHLIISDRSMLGLKDNNINPLIRKVHATPIKQDLDGSKQFNINQPEQKNTQPINQNLSNTLNNANISERSLDVDGNRNDIHGSAY